MTEEDPRQAAYAAARAEWQRVVWPALERHRDAREEQQEQEA